MIHSKNPLEYFIVKKTTAIMRNRTVFMNDFGLCLSLMLIHYNTYEVNRPPPAAQGDHSLTTGLHSVPGGHQVD